VAVAGETRVLIDQVMLFPADNMEGLDPEAVAMTKALKLPLLRFGGNFTSGYHWRDGVGPMVTLHRFPPIFALVICAMGVSLLQHEGWVGATTKRKSRG
jgi:hypothetical protein